MNTNIPLVLRYRERIEPGFINITSQGFSFKNRNHMESVHVGRDTDKVTKEHTIFIPPITRTTALHGHCDTQILESLTAKLLENIADIFQSHVDYELKTRQLERITFKITFEKVPKDEFYT